MKTLGEYVTTPGPTGGDQASIADLRGGGGQAVEVVARGGQQGAGLGDVEGGASLRAGQGPADLLRCHHRLTDHRVHGNDQWAGGFPGPSRWNVF